VLYLVALATAVGAWGLPLARDELFLWLGLGLLAFSVSAWRRWGVMLLEWLPFFGLLVAYDYLRGAVSVATWQAHVDPQIAFDKFIGFGQVPTVWLQEHLWHGVGHLHVWDYGIWCVYMSHFFTIWIVAAVRWRVAHDRFPKDVAQLVLTTIGAFLTYWLYPAQPPWLASDNGDIGAVTRIVPEVWGQLGVQTAKSIWEGHGDLVNLVAAMPSLHASYPFMLLLFFWPAGWIVRGLLGFYTLAMAFTLTYGGEHFVIDLVVGYVFTAIAFLIVTYAPAAWRMAQLRWRLRTSS